MAAPAPRRQQPASTQALPLTDDPQTARRVGCICFPEHRLRQGKMGFAYSSTPLSANKLFSSSRPCSGISVWATLPVCLQLSVLLQGLLYLHKTPVPSSPCTSERHQAAGCWQSQQRSPASHWEPGLVPSRTSHISSWGQNRACLHLCRIHLETSSHMKARPCQSAGCPSCDSLSKAPSSSGQAGIEGKRAISGLCRLLRLPAGLHVG